MAKSISLEFLEQNILGSLPGDFDTTDTPGFSPSATGGSGLPISIDDGPSGFNNFPGGPGANDVADNVIDNGGDSNDVNCDYLGTCYDGLCRGEFKTTYNISYAVCSLGPLQGHAHRGERGHQQALLRPHLRARPLRDLQRGRHQQRHLPPGPHHGRPGLQHPVRGQ